MALIVAGRLTPRIPSVDVVRGGVMVLMALDHVRDWVTNARVSPEDLRHGSFALFATRWVTHFCAPTFFLLAGIGIGILRARGRSASELTWFLLTRGVWLLILELIITPVGWQFGFQFVPAFALVLWALGWSMVIMSLAVHLPVALVTSLSLVIIGAHNLLDRIRPEDLGSFAGLWRILHVPGFAVPDVIFIAYPLVPWVAVMGLGYGLATVYRWEARRRQRTLLWWGVLATLLFVGLRGVNGYGDPLPWTTLPSIPLTVASFLNTRKYPPSLDFLLMTLGPALIALALAEHARGRWAGWLAVYGRVPLFFYVIHIFLAHALAALLALVQGGELMRVQVVNNPSTIPAWYGLSLPGVYLTWALVVVLLFFPCRQFGTLKNTRGDWWVRYL